jgi:hypothetical protein
METPMKMGGMSELVHTIGKASKLLGKLSFSHFVELMRAETKQKRAFYEDEARQKRITFDNTHYRIDLVFYHRLLRCHVLEEERQKKIAVS